MLLILNLFVGKKEFSLLSAKVKNKILVSPIPTLAFKISVYFRHPLRASISYIVINFECVTVNMRVQKLQKPTLLRMLYLNILMPLQCRQRYSFRDSEPKITIQ